MWMFSPRRGLLVLGLAVVLSLALGERQVTLGEERELQFTIPILKPTPRPILFPTPPKPTPRPTPKLTEPPTPKETLRPTPRPTPKLTKPPTPKETLRPTPRPTPKLTEPPTPKETLRPTPRPTPRRTPQPKPTPFPSASPTPLPTQLPTKISTSAPSRIPTSAPSVTPTFTPSRAPSRSPSLAPTGSPTRQPTSEPTEEEDSSLLPGIRPTPQPILVSTQCFDGVQNGGETDVDCGGLFCRERCNLGKGCKFSSDCKGVFLCAFEEGEPGRCSLVSNLGASSGEDVPCLSGCGPEATCVETPVGDRVCISRTDVRYTIDLDLTDTTPPTLIYEWPAIMSTTLVTVGALAAVGSGSSFLFMELIDFSQFSAFGGQMILPSAPSSFVNYSTTFFWQNLVFFPLGDTETYFTDWKEWAQQTGSISGRRLQEEEVVSTLHGMERFALAVKIVPRYLLLSCILCVLLVFVVYVLANAALLAKRQKVDFYSVVQEAGVRITFYTLYPLSTFASYALFLTFVETREFVSGTKSDKAWQSLLSFFVFMGCILWGWKCFSFTRYGDRDIATSNFRSLVADWREGQSNFWVVKALNCACKGLFLGLITTPSPIQAASFLVVSFAYLCMLVLLKPYRYSLANKVAIVVACLYVLNTILPILFSLTPAPFSDHIGDKLGTVQIGLNIICLLGLAMIAVAQAISKAREKKRANKGCEKGKDVEERRGSFSSAADEAASRQASMEQEGLEQDAHVVKAEQCPADDEHVKVNVVAVV